MPSELRHIMFSPAETVEAVIEHKRRAREVLPVGNVISTACEAPAMGAAISFTFTIQPDRAAHGAPPAAISLEGSELQAALLCYCRQRGIAIAMKAEKSLQRIGGRVALVLTLNARAPEAFNGSGAAPPG